MKNKCGERWMNKQMDDKMDGRGGWVVCTWGKRISERRIKVERERETDESTSGWQDGC